MKRILFFIVFGLICFCGCGNSFTIDGFTSSPADSVGAGCIFFDPNNKSLQLFATGVDSIAYISLSGAMVTFRLVESKDEEVNDSTTNFTDVYTNGDYELKVEMKQTGISDSGNDYEGTMTVKKKNGRVITKKIAGSCGC